MERKPCVVCSQPATTFCEECDGHSFDQHKQLKSTRRFYCSEDCKHKDWPNHKKECDSIVYHRFFLEAQKAGQVAQSLFLTFLDRTWTYDFKEVSFEADESGDLAYIEVIAGAGVKNGPGVGESDCERLGGGWLFQYELDRFRGSGDLTDEAQQVVLMDGRSFWAFIVMHTVVRLLFKDLVNNIGEDIKEVTHTLPPCVNRLVTYKVDARHESEILERNDLPYAELGETAVFEITLKSGQKVALDLAGRQYNLPHVTTLDWETYWDQYGGRLLQRTSFGTALKNHEELHTDLNQRDVRSLLCIDGFALQEFNSKIEKEGIKVEQLRKIIVPQAFTKAKVDLNKQISNYLTERIGQIDGGFIKDPKNPDSCSGLRHHDLLFVQRAISFEFDGRSMILPDVGSLDTFDWDIFRTIISDMDEKGREGRLSEEERQKNRETRDEAKQLLIHGHISKPWQDWKLSMGNEIIAKTQNFDTGIKQGLMVEKEAVTVNPKLVAKKR